MSFQLGMISRQASSLKVEQSNINGDKASIMAEALQGFAGLKQTILPFYAG